MKNVCFSVMLLSLLMTHLLRADEENQNSLTQKLQTALQEENSKEAVRLLDQMIENDQDNASLWYARGVENFRVGKFKKSVEDFDQFVELRPAAERRLWERGISHYYAGMYKEGAEQFALYQTYHDNDVENSVWRFLCMAKTDGLEKARAEMLPIRNDPRIPLMEVYALFQGKSTPENVLAKISEEDPKGQVLAGRQFYGQLYLGLYYEAHGQPKLARKYLTQAWKDHAETEPISRYMWHVARVHVQNLDEPKKQ